MRTEPSRVRRLTVVLSSAAILATGVVLARQSVGQTDSGPRAGSAPLPAALAGKDPSKAHGPAGAAGLPPADRAAVDAATHHQVTSAQQPGVPVSLTIPIKTAHHPNGVHAQVTANELNDDGTLHVPDDPTTVSWAKQDVAPGSSHGTAILTSHINYVVDGKLIIGALSDLAWYAEHSIGKTISVHVADGRTLRYRIVAGREYTKDQLAADPGLRAELYNQRKVYGSDANAAGRLLLVSCGGAFDAYTGEYQDNVFLYALPA